MTNGDQGTAAGAGHDRIELGGAGLTSGFLQVMPEDFTRDELRDLLDKTRELLQFGLLSDVKRTYLECMEEDLDVLDALSAREELDIQTMTEAIRGDPHYVPHVRRAYPPEAFTYVTHNAPPCGPNCPYNED